MRLDRFISKRQTVSERCAREWIVAERVVVNGAPNSDYLSRVTRFDEVKLNGEIIQPSSEILYLMLNKPEGILSATRDDEHTTVIDLIDHPDKTSLHLAGRLDRSSTGLVLLTNDGNWSERLTQPGAKVAKSYLVETDRPIPDEAVERFREGFDFATEGIRTRPAELTLLSPTLARVILYEGRYHQIKRMFHRIDEIRLISLHRESIGRISLPKDLSAGEWRTLSQEEIKSVA